MINQEVKKFIEFRKELINLLENSFDVVQTDYDVCELEGDPKAVADLIIDLIEKYEKPQVPKEVLEYNEAIFEDKKNDEIKA
jgi:hypothetical protein